MLLLSLPMNSKDPMKGFHGMDCAGCDGRGMGRSVYDRSGFHVSEIGQREREEGGL